MKKIFIVSLICLFCISIAVVAVAVEVETKVEAQLGRDYQFDFLGIDDIDAELSSQTYTVGAVISIGDALVVTPRIGVWDSEIEIEDAITLENETGLLLGVAAEYALAKPIDGLTVSLIGDYSYAQSEVDVIKISNLSIDNPIRNDVVKHDLEGGVRADYANLPMNGVASLGLVYSRSVIDVEANLVIINLDLELEAQDNIGLRPALSFEPTEDITVVLGGKLIDQEAIELAVSYKF